jgi:hypothetical protein
VSFRNPDALQMAVLASVVATVLFFLPFVNWVAAGYAGVFFYRKRTRQTVNLVAGVRMGWLTGIITFVIMAVFIGLGALALRTPEVLEMFKTMAQKNDSVQQLLVTLQNGPRLATMLAMYFVMITFLSMTGGMLGAVLTGRATPPPRGGNIA